MLSELLGSAITKVLSILALLFLSTSLLMTKLYLEKREELTSLQSTYRQLQETSKELVESKEKVVIGNQQDDTILLDKIGKIDSLNKDKDSLLKKLASIPKCPLPTPIKGSQDVQVNIDDELPVDVISLLNESYNQNKRSSDTPK